MNITAHGKERFSERTGLSKRLVDRTAQRALEEGLTHAEVTGKLERFMDGLYMRHRNGNNSRIFNGQVYVFQDDTLVTVLPLSYKLRKIAEKQTKRRVGEKSTSAIGEEDNPNA